MDGWMGIDGWVTDEFITGKMNMWVGEWMVGWKKRWMDFNWVVMGGYQFPVNTFR